MPTEPANRATVDYPEFSWTRVYGAEKYQIQVAQDRRFVSKRFEYTTYSTHYMPPRSLPAAAYWWRVRVIAPFRSSWSDKRSFTRRWVRQTMARPDHVKVLDYSSAPGAQAPMNALEISWDPVDDASYYVAQFDRIADADPDVAVTPPYGASYEPPEAQCITTHTILTPNQGQVSLPEQGAALVVDGFPQDCTLGSPGLWAMRVRAVDRTSDGAEIFSLWSDEARGPGQPAPGPTYFTVGARLPEDPTRTPAVITGPENGTKFVDSPVLTWNPKAIGLPSQQLCPWTATDPCYKVVIALDPDFTTEVGHFWTTNTRFMPLARLPEDNAERAYYWYVVPCDNDYCISSNEVVNRPSIYRSFVKLSPRLDTYRVSRRAKPFTVFKWSTAMRTAKRFGRASESVGGIDYYEFQTRLPGQTWPDDALPTGSSPTEGVPTEEDTTSDGQVYFTDSPEFIPEHLAFNTPYQWRVRVVDSSGQTRPWSIGRDVVTMQAAPQAPPALRAKRIRDRVTVRWSKPRSPYFPVTGYDVFYSLNGRRWKSLVSTGALSTTARIAKGTRYWFSVTAKSRGGASKPSKVVVGK